MRKRAQTKSFTEDEFKIIKMLQKNGKKKSAVMEMFNRGSALVTHIFNSETFDEVEEKMKKERAEHQAKYGTPKVKVGAPAYKFKPIEYKVEEQPSRQAVEQGESGFGIDMKELIVQVTRIADSLALAITTLDNMGNNINRLANVWENKPTEKKGIFRR